MDASQGTGKELISPLFLRKGTIPILSYVLQVWFCDLELISLFEEQGKKKGRKRERKRI